MVPKLEIHYSGGEWAALYVDGQLEVVGDAHLAEERTFELLGVTVEYDDAFLRGQTKASGVAQTVDEVTAYRNRREQRAAKAHELREQAARLTDEAIRLERG